MTTATAQTVQYLNLAYFGRPADPASLTAFPASGMTDEQIVLAFVGSGEYNTNTVLPNSSVNAAGTRTFNDTALINSFYQRLFGRLAAVSEISGWTTALNNGTVNHDYLGITIMRAALNLPASTEMRQVMVAKYESANLFSDTLAADSASNAAYTTASAVASGQSFLSGITTTTAATSAAATAAVATMVGAYNTGLGQTYTLTTAVDVLTGTTGWDTFVADDTGTDVLSVADSIDGGAGTDTLKVYSDGTASAVPELTSVEKVIVYDQDADVTFASTNYTSVDEVSLVRGDSAAVTVGANVTTVNFQDIVAGSAATGANVALQANFAATATSGTVGLNGMTAAGGANDEIVDVTGALLTDVTFTTSGTASTVDGLDAASATTVSINAGANLTANVAGVTTAATVAALNVSGAGNVNIGTLDTGFDTVTNTGTGIFTAAIGAATDTVLTSGAGADVITASTADTIATTATLAVDAGAGTDTLAILQTADVNTAADAARYTNFETVRVTQSYDGDTIAGITAVETAGNASMTYSDLSVTQAANVMFRADETAATITQKDATGTSDVLDITLGFGGQAAATDTTAAADVVTGITAAGFETINFTEAGGASATAGAARTSIVAALTAANVNDINLFGRGMTISNVATTLAVDIDGSALTGNGNTGTAIQGLTVAGSAVAGSTITGSAFNDSFTVGAEGTTYNGGAGTDAFSATVTLITNDGTTDTVLNGGAGTDTLTLTNTTGNTLTDNQFVNLSGFEALTLTNTGAADTSITTGAAFNTAFADGAVITSGLIAATQDITVAAGLSTVDTTVTIAATSQTGAATETNSLVTGSGNDTITYTDTGFVGVAGAAQGTIVIDTNAGNDTISVTVGTLVAAAEATGQALTITGGSGQDSITKVGTNSGVAVGTAIFAFAAGDSSTTAYDTITGYDMTATGDMADTLNFEGTAAVGSWTATTDFGTIKSHSTTAGIITFDDVADFATALVINSANLTDVVGYLQTNAAANSVVAFAYDSTDSGTADGFMVFHQGSAATVADDLVFLASNTTADSVVTTNVTNGANDIFVA